jgi:hypothetical protein
MSSAAAAAPSDEPTVQVFTAAAPSVGQSEAAKLAWKADTIIQLVLTLTWNCTATTPRNKKNPLFAQIFPTFVALQEITSATELSFAAGLFQRSCCRNDEVLGSIHPDPREAGQCSKGLCGLRNEFYAWYLYTVRGL